MQKLLAESLWTMHGDRQDPGVQSIRTDGTSEPTATVQQLRTPGKTWSISSLPRASGYYYAPTL